MDPTIIVAIINAVALVIGSYIVHGVRKDVGAVRKEMNGMKDALVAGARREGVTEGKQIEKDKNGI